MTRGFFTIAQNSKDDYVKMAYTLALSLKKSQKRYGKLSIGVTPNTKIPKKYLKVFDQVVEIPWDDHAKDSEWKLENEWKAIYMSPYEETIKLDADMIFTTDVSHWWDILDQYDASVCSNVKTYKGNDVNSRFYRGIFDKNELPNAYSGLFYFKKTPKAFDLFKMLEIITLNWEKFSFDYLKTNKEPFSTDVALALAIKLMGCENEYVNNDVLSFVHMKTNVQDWTKNVGEDWSKYSKVFLTNKSECLISSYKQMYPIHYHDKTLTKYFMKRLEEINVKK